MNGRLLAWELTNLGVDVDCVPMVDVRADNADPIVIGDRAFSDQPEAVAVLGRALADGLLAGGVLPVIKHLPGHGRAVVDSHYELPVVTANRETLRRTDFLPFRALSHLPIAMTGHIVLADYDPEQPATTSPTVIREVIRGEFGFDGLLITDDVSMGALSGSVAERTEAALAAGCDVALHCNGNLEEMHQVSEAAGRLTPKGRDRFAAIDEFRQVPPALDKDAAQARRDAIIAGGSAG